jgi:hypothetical protein
MHKRNLEGNVRSSEEDASRTNDHGRMIFYFLIKVFELP